MKSTVITLFIVSLVFGSVFYSEEKPVLEKNPVVLELFTSQGCSSCPPADKLLKDVESDNVITLSYHVDYWNYIGWKDPFSTKAFTKKQRKYGNKFYSSSIYTPQVVVNGREHFVGSNSQKLNEKIKKYAEVKVESKIEISDLNRKDKAINFNYNFENLKPNSNLRIVLVIDERITEIKRGENRNRTLVNSNIVVAEQKFKAEKTSGTGQIIIPEIVEANDTLSLVLILENNQMDITTATQKRL